MPLSFCAPVVPSNATRLPSVGDATFSVYWLCVWLAAAKSAAFLPLSFCLPVVPSNATRLPSVGDATLSGFPAFSRAILVCIAVWSAAVKYLPITSPADHARAVVPSCARTTVSVFPLFAVIRTVSAVDPSAPIVSRFGASGSIDPSTTFTVVPAAVSAPDRDVSGVFACGGYIVTSSDIS